MSEWEKKATCHQCGQVGHIRPNCPNAPKDPRPASQGAARPARPAAAAVPEGWDDEAYVPPQVSALHPPPPVPHPNPSGPAGDRANLATYFDAVRNGLSRAHADLMEVQLRLYQRTAAYEAGLSAADLWYRLIGLLSRDSGSFSFYQDIVCFTASVE